MGKSSPKQKESENEKALAQVSQQKWDRYEGMYRGVEKSFIEQNNRDTVGLIKGRAVADVMQASNGGFKSALTSGRGSASNMDTYSATMPAARIDTSVDANKTAQSVKDSGNIDALKIGQDMAVDAQNGLAKAARASNEAALGKAKAALTRSETMHEVLGAAAYMGYEQMSKPKELKVDLQGRKRALYNNTAFVKRM